MDRRQFLERSAFALAANVCPALATGDSTWRVRPLAVFTKSLEGLAVEEPGKRVAALGIKGIEAPIRAGGHVEPKAVPERLANFVEGLKKHGVGIDILTSDIGQADPAAEELLRTAASLGIKRYRLVHYRYDLKKPVGPQLAEVKAKLKDLAAMNRELGVQGQYVPGDEGGSGDAGEVAAIGVRKAAAVHQRRAPRPHLKFRLSTHSYHSFSSAASSA